MTEPMTPQLYLDLSEVTEKKFSEPVTIPSENMELLHHAMGMVTEAGEFMDALKKHFIYGKAIDKTNLREELGDILWYVAGAMRLLDTTFEAEMQRNIDKLRARYGDKFSEHAALNRDLNTERKILEEPNWKFTAADVNNHGDTWQQPATPSAVVIEHYLESATTMTKAQEIANRINFTDFDNNAYVMTDGEVRITKAGSEEDKLLALLMPRYAIQEGFFRQYPSIMEHPAGNGCDRVIIYVPSVKGGSENLRDCEYWARWNGLGFDCSTLNLEKRRIEYWRYPTAEEMGG